MIAAGTSAATFPIATSGAIQTQLSATIQATYGPKSVSAMLAIDPPPVTLASVTLQPPAILGGLSGSGTVMLTRAAPPEGATVTLASSDLSIATVPANVVVPGGASAASFTINTSTILAPAVAGITATWNGVSQTAILTVNPPSTLSLYSLTVDPQNVAGGGGATGTVVLTGPAPNGGVDVTLTSSDPATVTVPVRVRVKGGDTTAAFSITTHAVTSSIAVTIGGQYGQLAQSDVLTVIPPTAIRLVSVTLSPMTVVGGSAVTGTVAIEPPAPAGGIAVTLSSKQKKLVTLPGTVLVAENATTAAFTIATQTVRRNDTAEIRASFAGVTRAATLTVTPPAAALLQRWRTWMAHASVRPTPSAPPLSLSVTAPVAAALPAGTPRRISLYSPELQLMAETETSTAATPPIAYEYVYFGGQPLAQIETATSRVRYYFNDHLGTPLLTTDATGSIDWRVEREPYGASFAIRAGATIHQPLAFPGQEEGGEGTLSYNIFRWYRSLWGRYTQADPLGLAGGTNLYSYVSERPVSAADRLGLVDWNCNVVLLVKAGEIVGGGGVVISCKSDCVNNKSKLVQLAGLAGGISIGLPIGVSVYQVKVHDPYTEPAASNLSGYFSIHALGASILWGGTVEADVTVGTATGKTSGWGFGGITAGFDSFAGITTPILDFTSCCK